MIQLQHSSQLGYSYKSKRKKQAMFINIPLPIPNLNSITLTKDHTINSRQSIEPPFKHKSPVHPIAISRQVIDPPPLLSSFPAVTPVPQRQFPDPLRREANPIAAAKHLELARLLETPENFRRHPPALVPLHRIEIQPQDQDRRARRIQRERRFQPSDHQNPVPCAANQPRPLQDIENIPPLVPLHPAPPLRGGAGDVAGEELPLAPPRRADVAEGESGVSDEDGAPWLRREVGGEFQPAVVRPAGEIKRGELS